MTHFLKVFSTSNIFSLCSHWKDWSPFQELPTPLTVLSLNKPCCYIQLSSLCELSDSYTFLKNHTEYDWGAHTGKYISFCRNAGMLTSSFLIFTLTLLRIHLSDFTRHLIQTESASTGPLCMEMCPLTIFFVCLLLSVLHSSFLQTDRNWVCFSKFAFLGVRAKLHQCDLNFQQPVSDTSSHITRCLKLLSV